MAVTIQDNGYIFVPRKDWGARYSAGRTRMPRPVSIVRIHHTVTKATADPCHDMRVVEGVLHSRGLAPGYSYTVHPSGAILEGAGDNKGAHTAGHNSNSYAFSLIGNYDQMHPTLIQLVNIARSINLMRLSGALVPRLEDIQIVPHRATAATACPGANMVNPNIPGPDGKGRTAIEWIRWFAGTGA